MRADELIKKYHMEGHVENGLFLELNLGNNDFGRASSDGIYYYVAPGEHTQFHRIDCDEYWCFNAGSTLELWVVDLDGNLKILQLGVDDNSETLVKFQAGEIFASRLNSDADDGCFISCITVPAFTYDGFEMLEKDVMIDLYPETESFWDDF